MLKKARFSIIFLTLITIVISSCNRSAEHPGYDYFPDMRFPISYDSYGENQIFEDEMNARSPVPGTIPRGFTPFHYENTEEDYERAGRELTNPFPVNDIFIRQGEYLYNIYCAICHGTGGEGDGPIVQREKFPPPPSFFNDYMMALPDGKMFFSAHYGRGVMGSYASQLSSERRWKVIAYINQLQNNNNGNGTPPAAPVTGAETPVNGTAAAGTDTQNGEN